MSDLRPALREEIARRFVLSYVPHQTVRVSGSDAAELATFLNAAGIVREAFTGYDGTRRGNRPDVDVIAGDIHARRFAELCSNELSPTLIVIGAATRHVALLDAAERRVEAYTIEGTVIRPRLSREQPLVAVVASARGEKRKLHLACGPRALPGWINIDNQPYPGINRLLDLRDGLPFHDADFIFAEHFIEHIEYVDAVKLLTECRRALGPAGVLRVSTPNLDWVHAVYQPSSWQNDREAIRDCLVMNRAFRGWGHRFLYNRSMLTDTLRQAGFASVTSCRYGESSHPELKGVEQHEQYPDSPELPHVLIAEASGIAAHERDESVSTNVAEYIRDIGVV